MPLVFTRLILPLLLVVAAGPARAQNGLAIDPATCLGCHGDKIPTDRMAESVHGKNGCTSCHIEIVELDRHMRGEVTVGRVRCARCHKKEAAEHAGGVHMVKGVRCVNCHTDMHTHTAWKGDKRRVLVVCLSCHSEVNGFDRSIHGKGVLAGNQDSAACNDCHGLHRIMPLGSPNSHGEREFHTRVCLGCHADRLLAERNGISQVAVKSYMESYHGKNYRLGYPEKVAGCADCHTAHSVLPTGDPGSSVHPGNLVKTCGVCHEKAGALFTRFYAHGEHRDRERYPVLYYTWVGMTALLVGTFTVFWLHTLLWMVRGFIENHEKAAALEEGIILHKVPESYRPYRRFRGVHVFMHLLVIVSFLGLSLTGLPLKFTDQVWARVLMELYGGAPRAGLYHRVFAGLTFAYFAMAIAMSVHFLFIGKDVKGNFRQRLLGPDSLCPNLRDLDDLAGMLRWFFFRGPKPSFERWTYWEKFDFIAVFWGMFAIGGSGLMLWFPEFFGGFLPGWAFNVATIVHSDEALLATGFIFTVHFFNTHGRPEKFPMDFVIFSGQISQHEFVEERGDQWARYRKEGVTERFAVGRSSGILYDFCLKAFGFAALFTGIGLLVLMVYAFMHPNH